ncbi:cell division protein FtsI (penicillin-binding protein 3) [Runella defluvii]|uniref:Cell division protein FtsI (Penicillin-binding protein 3) n=1 Tax=Runella defluvii TaxID=370973 RepID=A0A7W5ZFU7_9BACT|nr:penicillin-binding protein [Runella defluvii]MBB3836064.1 cell division protein FtsI (penicillin-binding protein 3) [Runella defluvii]
MLSRPKNIREDISRRSWIVAIGLIVLGAVVIYRIFYIQHFALHKDKPWIEYMSTTMHIDTIEAMRGNIYSNDGSLMATSLPYFEVSLDPTVTDSTYFYSRVDSVATLLSALFQQRTAEDYRREMVFARHEFEKNKKKGNRNIRLVKRRITYREYNIILNQSFTGFVYDKKAKKKVKGTWKGWPFFRRFATTGRSRGGKLTVVYERYNPFGSLAERTIGDLDKKTRHGSFGIEASFDNRLAGTPGIGLYRVLDDQTFMPNDDDEKIQPVNGYDLHTTIDVNFQDIAETALRNTLERYRASYGSVIVMEVQTGEIRAIANLSRSSDSTYSETYNYALAGLSNPGSTFKLPTMLAAFEEGLPLSKMYHTGNGNAKYRSAVIRDTKKTGHGSITAQQVFEKSSNVGVHLIMKDYFYAHGDKYVGYLKRFHLREPTGIHMKGEPAPRVRTPSDKRWSKTSLTYMSYGYESELTPLQMLAFYNAIANDGYWVRPMIVKQVKDADKVIQEYPVFKSEERIASENSIKKARTILEGVVDHGTATNIRNDHYKIAGKTGTAQKLVNGRYLQGLYNTSFIGYFPADEPRYTCLIVVDSPRGFSMEQLYAGSVAAPVFKEVADRIIGYDIKMHPPLTKQKNKTSEMQKQLRAGHSADIRIVAEEMDIEAPVNVDGWVEAKKEGDKVAWANRDTDPTKVPNLKGMSLRDALYLLENHGFKVKYSGRGKVASYTNQGGVYSLVLR